MGHEEGRAGARPGRALLRKRELARGFFFGLGLLFLGSALLSADWGWIVDEFHEQRVERLSLDVWKRQATPVDYAECRRHPPSCLGKYVAWEITAQSSGSYKNSPAEPIRWLNAKQVPGGTYEAVARIVAVDRAGMDMIFLGTPIAPYGGTVWAKKFGYREPPRPYTAPHNENYSF